MFNRTHRNANTIASHLAGSLLRVGWVTILANIATVAIAAAPVKHQHPFLVPVGNLTLASPAEEVLGDSGNQYGEFGPPARTNKKPSPPKPSSTKKKNKADNQKSSPKKEQADADVTCGKKVNKECPEPAVTYHPSFPPLGRYSAKGVCESIHDDTSFKVTLRDNESLETAADRLLELSYKAGGVLEIPWDVDTLQCDRYHMGGTKIMPITIRGVPGPNGELPRFYCRSVKRDGTVPRGTGDFLRFGKNGTGKSAEPGNHQVVIENIHVDGYGTSVQVPRSGSIVIRNNYMHHNIGDGIKGVGVNVGDGPGWGVRIEVCGNEISHSGQGNTKHGLYIARSKVYGHNDSRIRLWFVDNVIHSCAWSSCLKSVANTNVVVGNSFYKTKETDPSYSTMSAQMLVDIAACEGPHEVRNNLFDRYRPMPDEAKSPGGVPIGIRNRKQSFGCNVPRSWEENDKTGGLPHPVKGSKFWSENYWSSLKGKKIFPFYITGNTFRATGYKAGETTAIASSGTYPNYRSRSFGPACLLTPPSGWYERHRTYVSNNTYINYPKEARERYSSNPPGHSEKACKTPKPKQDLRDFDLIEVGPGEVVIDDPEGK